MAVYTTLTRLKKYLDVNTIIQLTDDHNTKAIVQEIVDEKILMSTAEIDSYMRGRYPVEIDDIDDVPEMIQNICTILTADKLYQRRLALTLPPSIERDYKLVIQQLKDIQSGKISPYPAEDEPTVSISNKTSDDRTYTSTVWDTY